MSKIYEVRVIEEQGLGTILSQASKGPRYAKRFAERVAMDHRHGVAILDVDGERADYGDGFERVKRGGPNNQWIPVGATRIILGWDAQDSRNEGWHAEVQTQDEEGEWAYADDSLKAWFPVNVDRFRKNQEAQVRAALLRAFPGASIR